MTSARSDNRDKDASMMHDQERAVESEPAGSFYEAPDAPLPMTGRTVWEPVWRGAKLGFRSAAYAFGTLAFLIALPSASLTAFALASGRGWGVHPSLPGAFGLFAFFSAFGGVVGGLLGWIGSLFSQHEFEPGSRRGVFGFGRRMPKEIAPRFRPRRWPWVVCGFSLIVLATAFGVGVYVGGFVDRRLARAAAAADADDPNWRLDDLMAHREVVPDEENSALVVADAASMIPDQWLKPPQGTPSSDGDEAERAWGRIAGAPLYLRPDDDDLEVVRAELGTYQDAVQLARSVANFDRGRHEVELGQTLIDTRLAETQATRKVARLLEADSCIRAADGDLDGALDSCRAIISVGRSIGDEPFAISHLVRVAIGSVGLNSARRVLGQSEPSEPAVARFQMLLQDELAQPILLHGIRGERAISVELIRRMGSGEIPIGALAEGAKPLEQQAPEGVIAPWGKLWFDHQLAVDIELMNEIVAICRLKATERPARWEAFDKEIKRYRSSPALAYTAMMPLLLMPAVSADEGAQRRYEASLGTAIIVVAAERHRKKTGDWPTSIAAIDPAILRDAPLDPYTGKPFQMTRRDGQFLVYSLGPNLIDEAGDYQPKQWTERVHDDIGFGAWDVSLRRSPKQR